MYLKDLEIDNDKNNSINQTNNSNSSSNKIDEQIKTLTSRRSELCIQVAKIDQNTYNNICDSWQGRNQTPTKEQTLTYLKEDIRKLEMRVNSTNSNTQQNDLSEYNRSKAEMEQKLAEKNAEITRQNQENARLGQIWNNAIKAGVDAHNKGNYTEAKNQFTIAINNSSNESNRQNAQNYYNKSVEAEERNRKQQLYDNSFNQAQKSLENKDYTGAIQSYGEAGKNAPTNGQKNVALGGVLATGTIGIFDAIAKAKEEKRQEQEKERIEKAKKAQEIERANEEQNEKYRIANEYADLETNEGFLNAIEIMLPYANTNKLNGMALNDIGFWYWKLNDYPNALKWYKKGASLKNANAMSNIGVLYVVFERKLTTYFIIDSYHYLPF